MDGIDLDDSRGAGRTTESDSGIKVRFQLLVRARKLLGADWRFAELRGLLATQPFLAGRSAFLYRLHHDLEDAPELRPYLFYATEHGLEAVGLTDSPESQESGELRRPGRHPEGNQS